MTVPDIVKASQRLLEAIDKSGATPEFQTEYRRLRSALLRRIEGLSPDELSPKQSLARELLSEIRYEIYEETQ